MEGMPEGQGPEEAALLAQDGRPSASDEQVLQALIQQPDAMSLLHLLHRYAYEGESRAFLKEFHCKSSRSRCKQVTRKQK